MFDEPSNVKDDRAARDRAVNLIREASLDAWDQAILTGEGELAAALRLLAPEIDMPDRLASACRRNRKRAA